MPRPVSTAISIFAPGGVGLNWPGRLDLVDARRTVAVSIIRPVSCALTATCKVDVLTRMRAFVVIVMPRLGYITRFEFMTCPVEELLGVQVVLCGHYKPAP